MKKSRLVVLLLILAVAGVYIGELRIARAQTVVPPFTVQSSVPHTSCVLVASVTQYCFASDGLWVSVNGAAFTQLGASAAAPVLSVNSKKPDASGNVVISATSSAPTITMN